MGTTGLGVQSPAEGTKEASYRSPECPSGPRVHKAEGGDAEALVVGRERQTCGFLHRDQLGLVVVSSVGASSQRHAQSGWALRDSTTGARRRHSPLHQQGPLELVQRVWAGRGPALL